MAFFSVCVCNAHPHVAIIRTRCAIALRKRMQRRRYTPGLRPRHSSTTEALTQSSEFDPPMPSWQFPCQRSTFTLNQKTKQARNNKRARARMLPYMYARELRKRALTRARTHAPCHAQARSRAIGVPRVKRAGLYVTPLAPDGAVRAGNLAQYRMNMSVATPRTKQTGNASAPWHIPATRARAALSHTNAKRAHARHGTEYAAWPCTNTAAHNRPSTVERCSCPSGMRAHIGHECGRTRNRVAN